jgi:tetratricopeptide (TPR) repeat protein
MSAIYNWGNVLAELAAHKEGPEQDRLYAEAFGKFAEALRIKPDKYEALYNWGHLLAGQAEGKEGPEQDRLYAEASDKFAEALRIKPDYHESLNNQRGAGAGPALRGSVRQVCRGPAHQA